MSAVTIQSQSSSNLAYNNSVVTIAKPTGLAVGDLMVVFLGHGDRGGTIGSPTWSGDVTWLNLSGASGFSNEYSNSVNDGNRTSHGAAAYKIADSADVAKTNFVFTHSSVADVLRANGGIIFRVDGHEDSSPIGASLSSLAAEDDTPSFATGITPTESSLLFMFNVLSLDQNASVLTMSGYAITTSNPSWTENFESLAGETGMSTASATRPETTSTGAWSYSTTNNGTANLSDHVSFLIAIKPNINSTINADVQNIASSIQAPTITGGANVSPAVLSVASAVQAPTITTPANTWSNTSKSSTTWTNLNKS